MNRGKIFGEPALQFEGFFHGLVLDARGARFARISLGPAVFPYRVTVVSNVSVTGDLVLAGGDFYISSGTRVTVMGDVLFKGTETQGSITPDGLVILHGTIECEGPSRYVSGSSGWVKMVGRGTQRIVPAGILPPIRIGKKNGKVIPSADLHTAGLFIEPGNMLDLSAGQAIVFGVPFKEWRRDPKSIIVLRAARPQVLTRGWRGLFNRGAIVGRPNAPFRFIVAVAKKTFLVEGRYSFQRPKRKDRLAVDNPLAGDLSINTPGSRLAIKGEDLLMDGKRTARLGQAPSKPSEAEQDIEEELEAGLNGEDGLGGLSEPRETKARLPASPCGFFQAPCPSLASCGT